jgi:hypothetical protein
MMNMKIFLADASFRTVAVNASNSIEDVLDMLGRKLMLPDGREYAIYEVSPDNVKGNFILQRKIKFLQRKENESSGKTIQDHARMAFHSEICIKENCTSGNSFSRISVIFFLDILGCGKIYKSNCIREAKTKY